MSRFVKKHPAISILILSNLLGLGMAYPVIAGLVPSDSMLFLVAAYSASLSGVILTAIVSGKTGLKEMFRRLLIWRVGIWWWGLGLFALLIMFLLGTVGNALFTGSTLVMKLAQPLYMFVPLFIMKFFLDAGLGEELGWRGFLLPRLQARHSALVASIIVGIVWGLWHVPLFMVEGMSPTYEFGQAYGVIPATLGHMVVITIPWAILYTWFYNNTKGSLLLAFVFHSSQAWFEIFRNPDNLFGPYYWYMGIMVVTAIVVVLVYGAKNLSRKHERIMIRDA
ncbi:type II CAAX prenyl endopeptidase Rce1 family protein [Chloroflexota bacterium]